MDELQRSRYLTEKIIGETIRHGPTAYRPAHMTLDQASALSHGDIPDALTRRETEVLSLVARGLTDGQVARSLTISANTVHAHLVSIYSKLGVSSRTAAARFAFEIGL
ncbi:MAG TPA: LuxR C-terminal-related transcriptional regulator [Chloroflexia bacterium]|nr:LuxR C-terminal-related transcriptional regulator [Chloroflexia bacterium]